MKTLYKKIGEISFHNETPEEVCQILANANRTSEKVKLYFGDKLTGRDWNEEYDTIGRIGKSAGDIHVPILLKTKRSIGGGQILDHCIVKIKSMASGMTLYQHPGYVQPEVEIVHVIEDIEFPYETLVNGNLHGRHKTERSEKITKNRIL